MAAPPNPNPPYHLRLATLPDIPALQFLIDLSVRALHAPYYTPAQIAAALSSSIYGVDTQLVLDGHYFVITTPTSTLPSSPFQSSEEIIASGGWSHRSTLYGGSQYTVRNDALLDPATDAAKIRAFFVHPDWTRRGLGSMVLSACEGAAREAGFRRAEMGATLSGVPFYGRMGYVEFGERERVVVGGGEVVEVVRMGKDIE